MSYLRKIHKITAKGFDGITRQKAETLIHKTLDPIFKGVHRDHFWKPIHDGAKALAALDIYPQALKTEYQHDKEGHVSGKEWLYDIPFGEKGGWHMRVLCSFGPSKIGETDAYDIIYTLNWDGRMRPNV